MDLKKIMRLVSEGKIEGKIEVTGRGGRRPKEVLDDFKKRRR